MKKVLTLILVFITSMALAQSEVHSKYRIADSLLKAEKLQEAYSIFKEIEPICNKEDTLYNYILWYYTSVTLNLESEARMAEKFDSSLKYGLETLNLIEKGKKIFDKEFAEREYWMIKNIVVSYFGLGEFDKANTYREKLYAAYKQKKLPDGLDGYFNFDFFTLNDKNIWGYEWYPALPKNRSSSSFTKIVYYVYSTNPDGSDKDQLYRFHVLMFHREPEKGKFDYILEKQIETDEAKISGSYYKYTYFENIDYKKLKTDIKEIVTNNIQPNTQRTIAK